MAKQNIYDNETFFEGYQKLREREVNANNLFEIPARFALLPDLKGLRVLDLGCGMGDDCMEYIRRGAKEVSQNGLPFSQSEKDLILLHHAAAVTLLLEFGSVFV